MAVGALTLAACASPARPWAATGEDFFAGLHAAYAAGFTNLGPFYAPDVTFDYVGFGGGVGTGRTAAVQVRRDAWQPTPALDGLSPDNTDQLRITQDEPLYVSLDGAVDPTRLFLDPFVIPAAFIYSIGRSGIESEMFTGSVEAAQMYGAVTPTVLSLVHRLAESYLRAWSTGDASAVSGLYASDAVVSDSLAGVRLDGPPAIGAAATLDASSGALKGAVARQIPSAGGKAYYFNWPTPVMVMLLDLGACPGQVAVAMTLDADLDKIAREERYHRVDAERRCRDPGSLQGGWWNKVSIPRADGIIRTGTLTAQGSPIALWNSTSGLQRLLSWALQQYANAALPIPTPTSITFLPNAQGARQTYGFEQGTGVGDRALTFAAADACLDTDCSRWTTWTKAATLHELAYFWLAHNSPPQSKAVLLSSVGLQWSDPARPAAQRGVEAAAEILTWGLMDEPYRPDLRLGHPTCEQLTRWFSLLTSADPSPRSCAEPAPAATGSGP